MIIKVGKTTREKLEALERLGYYFSGGYIHSQYEDGLRRYGEDLCFCNTYYEGDEFRLTFSPYSFYKEHCPDEEYVTLDEFLGVNNKENSKYIIHKKLVNNKDVYEVLRLENDVYVSFSEYQWKTREWAEAELQVRVRGEEC